MPPGKVWLNQDLHTASGAQLRNLWAMEWVTDIGPPDTKKWSLYRKILGLKL
jgi:hypothetical protein